LPALAAAVLASLLPAAISPAPSSRGLRAGFAKRVITPALSPGPVYLAGFGHDRRATGVHDDLFVRCLGVGDGVAPVLAEAFRDLVRGAR
jgi:hypothetical protein